MSHDNDIPSIDGLDAAIGLELVEVTPDICVGRVQVGPVHRQPYGIVHGGTYCTIVEALASAGAAMWAMAKGMPGVVGVANSTDFLRSHREGPIRGTATPVHRGRTHQLWQVEVRRESDDKLLARGQLRLQNIVDPSVIGGLTPGQRQT